jgi:hypothetical protein
MKDGVIRGWTLAPCAPEDAARLVNSGAKAQSKFWDGEDDECQGSAQRGSRLSSIISYLGSRATPRTLFLSNL